MNITVIGGGSTYTPELVEGLIEREHALGLNALCLHDLDHARLEVVGGFCQRMMKHARARFTLVLERDLDQALHGADFVLTQIRVGGQEGRRQDILLGLRHGLVGQETTGVGGFAKALRTIPVIQTLAERVRAVCPRAWWVNFTNPSGIITEALARLGFERMVGLCNIPIDMIMSLAKALDAPSDAIEVEYFGLNHLSWISCVMLRGEDVTERALALSGAEGPANIPEMRYDERFTKALRLLPSPYLRYFYEPQRMVEEIARGPNRAEQVMAIEAKLLAYYRDESEHEKPALLSERGGAWYSRVATRVIEAIASRSGEVHIVNTPNGDATPDLPPEAVIEAPARLDAEGATALPLGRLPIAVRGLVQQVKAYETLTVEAALAGSYDAALLALVNHPHVASVSLARAVLDDALRTHRLALR